MKREARRDIAKQLKGMSRTQVYAFVQDVCYKYGDELIKDAMVALHREFGFGKKRQDQFVKALNQILEERDPKKVQL